MEQKTNMRGKTAKYKVGLFVGRFQPFHIGHLHALAYAAKRCKKLVIGIGSAQEAGTEKNRFDAKTRIRMIKAAIKENKLHLENISFLKIPDFYSDEKWYSFIMQKVPNLEVVFSRNPWVTRIFRSRHVKIVKPPWYRRDKISGTKIRKRINAHKDYEKLVPKAVVQIIKKRAI